MRLIDADRLKGYLYENYIMYDHTIADIDAQPTVEAIPIEWIENKLNCCDNINAEVFVKALIRDWRKENGRSE